MCHPKCRTSSAGRTLCMRMGRCLATEIGVTGMADAKESWGWDTRCQSGLMLVYRLRYLSILKLRVSCCLQELHALRSRETYDVAFPLHHHGQKLVFVSLFACTMRCSILATARPRGLCGIVTASCCST